jgi:bifunctional polynucleotide phosphatase/kinase
MLGSGYAKQRGFIKMKFLHVQTYKSKMTLEQKTIGTMYSFIPDVEPTDKFACFDLDWTVAYGQKRLFPSDPDDIFILPKRKTTLTRLHSEGWTILIFTNQYAASKKERTKRAGRVKTALEKLEIPCWAFMAVGKDKKGVIDSYRKPAKGMWEHAVEMLGEPSEAFYCGDAAGRPQDFSDSDKKFAENIGIEFRTPEEVFPVSPAYKPRRGKELVVFVGMPGCGKSTYYRDHFSDYVHVNQDTLKTRAKVLKTIKDSASKGLSMVVDATNPALQTRQDYYDLVDGLGYKISVYYFTRDGRGWNDLRRPNHVPTIVYHKYFKNLDPPPKGEGSRVKRVW